MFANKVKRSRSPDVKSLKRTAVNVSLGGGGSGDGWLRRRLQNRPNSCGDLI